jgi:hypothetical protein
MAGRKPRVSGLEAGLCFVVVGHGIHVKAQALTRGAPKEVLEETRGTLLAIPPTKHRSKPFPLRNFLSSEAYVYR